MVSFRLVTHYEETNAVFKDSGGYQQEKGEKKEHA